MQNYSGSCHCGQVRFQIEAEITELTTCDCTLCVKKNALMVKVHKSAFTLETSQKSVTEYRWNTGVAQHFFCNTCGIYTFHKKRAQPDYYGINIYCLEGFDASGVSIRATDGATMSVVAASP